MIKFDKMEGTRVWIGMGSQSFTFSSSLVTPPPLSGSNGISKWCTMEQGLTISALQRWQGCTEPRLPTIQGASRLSVAWIFFNCISFYCMLFDFISYLLVTLPWCPTNSDSEFKYNITKNYWPIPSVQRLQLPHSPQRDSLLFPDSSALPSRALPTTPPPVRASCSQGHKDLQCQLHLERGQQVLITRGPWNPGPGTGMRPERHLGWKV